MFEAETETTGANTVSSNVAEIVKRAVNGSTTMEAKSLYHPAHPVEIDFPDFDLRAYFKAQIYEADEVPTNRIIRIDEDWGIKLDWWLKGRWAECLCGDWCVQVHFESIGKGLEFNLPMQGNQFIELKPCGDGHYSHDIKVPAGFVKPECCSSIYKIVASLTYRTPCKRPGPIAGFCELPMVQFYKSKV